MGSGLPGDWSAPIHRGCIEGISLSLTFSPLLCYNNPVVGAHGCSVGILAGCIEGIPALGSQVRASSRDPDVLIRDSSGGRSPVAGL
jgi:hypothetical protein